MSWTNNLAFINNVTPLDQENLAKLIGNVNFLHDKILNLIVDGESDETPLPVASGDGIIRYVVNVDYDMIWTENSLPTGTWLVPESRYFVSIRKPNTNTYHLEVWYYTTSGWWVDPNWVENEDGYTKYCWDRCTHNKLYVCNNTSKCYYMVNNKGTATIPGGVTPGTTDQAAYFMTEAAQSCNIIWKGATESPAHSQPGSDGFAHSLFLRYKMVIMNFHLSGEETSYMGNEITFSVAFNPWYMNTNNQVLFIPFTVPYFSSGQTDPNSVQTGTIKVYNDGSYYHFYAYVGSAYKQMWIDTLVGCADTFIAWGPIPAVPIYRHSTQCHYAGTSDPSNYVTLQVISEDSTAVSYGNLAEWYNLIIDSLEDEYLCKLIYRGEESVITAATYNGSYLTVTRASGIDVTLTSAESDSVIPLQ